jgi:hypothetical protein
VSKKKFMPAEVKEKLRNRAAEVKALKRRHDPVPADFSLVDMMAAVDWAREDNGYGKDADRPYLNLDGEGRYVQNAPVAMISRKDGAVVTEYPLLGYLRYAKALDDFLAEHLLHHLVLKSAGPGFRLVRVYRMDALLAVTKFLAPTSQGAWVKPGKKYVGWMDRAEYHSWALYTLNRTDRVRELLEKARKT